MSAPDFWSDSDHAQNVSKRAAELRTELDVWETVLRDISDLKDIAMLAQTEQDDQLTEELKTKLRVLEKKFARLEFTQLFSGSYDNRTAILSIHAGSGGTEAQDWTEMLLRMFVRFAEHRDWHVTMLHESRAEDVGIKSVTFRVEGRFAYGYLKSEAGVHRLVRISPFDAEKMRHTTFALVEVIPELDELDEIDIDPKDLRVDTFLSSGKGGQSVNTTYSAVRIVHLPTAIAVSCQNERSQQQNKETAMNILKSKLLQIQLREREQEKKQLRGDYQSAEWGNQIRSYVLHPYKLVKDHRSAYETTDTEAVLNGELEPFMEAYLRKQLEEHDRWAKKNEDTHL